MLSAYLNKAYKEQTLSLVNISFLANYYPSSTSKWEDYKLGHPTDGAILGNRFSVHTEKEHDPFVCFQLPVEVHVEKIVLCMRSQYMTNSLPLTIEALVEQKWQTLLEVNSVEDSTSIELNNSTKTATLRVRAKGFITLDFSSLNIFVEPQQFLKDWLKVTPQQSAVTYAHTDFYGLGGKLSVVATSLGYVGTSSSQKLPFVDKSLARVLSFPVAYQPAGDDMQPLRDFMSVYAPISINRFIHGESYTNERNIALHSPVPTKANESRKFSFFSRDGIEQFSLAGESVQQTKQRLYQRMIPSDEVMQRKALLAKKFPFDGTRALGLHIRHGNGELYLKEFEDQNRWGVKPPNFKEIIQELNSVLEQNTDINILVICSDSHATRDIVAANLVRKVKILFVSEFIQDVGCGCNHNNKVFDDAVKRKDLDRADEDILALAEILLLSHCDYLVGGSSFFFDTVIGFSQAKSDNIIQLNNKDRYTNLPKAYKIVNPGNAKELYDNLKSNHIPCDGLFINSTESPMKLYFFEKPLVEFNKYPQVSKKELKSIREQLLSVRGY